MTKKENTAKKPQNKNPGIKHKAPLLPQPISESEHNPGMAMDTYLFATGQAKEIQKARKKKPSQSDFPDRILGNI